MKLLKRIVKSPNFLPLLIVVVFAGLAARSLLFESGYFKMHDDLQMMRQLEMEKCFNDGQIPCRWVPDMGYGYGFPLFNFYPPLPYLTGEVFRVLQFSFVDTAKLTFALSFFLSGITMYFLSKEFFGKWGGTLSSIFYIWAPYHSVDIYVRGAMNEAWAFIWFPLILWTSYRLIKERKKIIPWFIGLALSWVGLLLSHNLMVMIFTPVFALWCLIFWIKGRDWKKFFQLVSSGVLAFCLAAFFTLPAILEQKYIHVASLTQGYYEYIAHYATINQLLFSRFWGYGPSVWGVNDGMPFQVGHVHWILSLILLCLAAFIFIKKRRKENTTPLIVVSFGLVVGWFAIFMAHSRSTFIWQHIAPLAFVQFPWRFLSLVVLCFSLVAGGIFKLLPKKTVFVVGAALAVFLIIFNWNYFRPDGGHMGPLTDAEKFQGAAWDLQRTAGIFDYLPNTAKENPKDGQNVLAEVVDGRAQITNQKQGTNWGSFNVNSDGAIVRINIFEFPDWEVFVDGKKVEVNIPDTEKWGRMYIEVLPGQHLITAQLYNTPIRSISNVVSLFAWIGLFVFLLEPWKMIQSKRG